MIIHNAARVQQTLFMPLNLSLRFSLSNFIFYVEQLVNLLDKIDELLHYFRKIMYAFFEE